MLRLQDPGPMLHHGCRPLAHSMPCTSHAPPSRNAPCSKRYGLPVYISKQALPANITAKHWLGRIAAVFVAGVPATSDDELPPMAAAAPDVEALFAGAMFDETRPRYAALPDPVIRLYGARSVPVSIIAALMDTFAASDHKLCRLTSASPSPLYLTRLTAAAQAAGLHWCALCALAPRDRSCLVARPAPGSQRACCAGTPSACALHAAAHAGTWAHMTHCNLRTGAVDCMAKLTKVASMQCGKEAS